MGGGKRAAITPRKRWSQAASSSRSSALASMASTWLNPGSSPLGGFSTTRPPICTSLCFHTCIDHPQMPKHTITTRGANESVGWGKSATSRRRAWTPWGTMKAETPRNMPSGSRSAATAGFRFGAIRNPSRLVPLRLWRRRWGFSAVPLYTATNFFPFLVFSCPEEWPSAKEKTLIFSINLF